MPSNPSHPDNAALAPQPHSPTPIVAARLPMQSPRSGFPKIHLASRSPRRRELLLAAGVEHDATHPGLDDGELRPGKVHPEQWVMALAYLKAASALHTSRASIKSPIVLGADTVVVTQDNHVIGQPTDEADARSILKRLRNNSHQVVTGIAIISALSGRRELFVDRATVHVGAISDEQIDAYIASGLWRGKAGAYNLAERIDAGWPITFDGDPGTVMGLPMRVLLPRLEAFAER